MTNLSNIEVGAIFGSLLERYRKETGISQEELAHRAEIDRTFVSRLERGIRQPTLTTLFALSRALNISAADLVAEIETHIGHETHGKRRRSTP